MTADENLSQLQMYAWINMIAVFFIMVRAVLIAEMRIKMRCARVVFIIYFLLMF